jgi:hypothetical protein
MHRIQPQTLATTSTQLALVGNCGYRIQDNRVVINIEEIASRRDQGDISGTLSIELWALTQPYEGGGFSGTALAGTQIGELYGQHFLANCRYDLLLQEPPAGTWYLTLMLREWTDAGFVTRDYVDFTLPYVVGSKPTVVRGEADNVISVSFAAKKKAAVKSVSEQSATVKAEAPGSEQAKPQATAAKKVPTSARTPAAEAPEARLSKPQDPPNPAAAPGKDESPDAGPVSSSKAGGKEIAATKGSPDTPAEYSVSAPPSNPLDDPLKVKGMGPTLLQKVRAFFGL